MIIYVCVCVYVCVCYTPETNNTVNQLYFNKKYTIFLIKKMNDNTWFMDHTIAFNAIHLKQSQL